MITRITALAILALLPVATARAVDLESFFFNDANDTPLSAAANTANPGNQWFYDEEATSPGDETTGDTSTVQSGVYQVITDSAFDDTGIESRILDIANVASGTVYLSATLSDWNFSAFDGATTEQLRFTFLDDDSGTGGSTVTAQMQIRRNADTGSMELFGDAIGTAGSFDIANTVDLPDEQTGPFTMVLALDKDSDSFEVFYKDGSAPSQALGLGGVSRVRDGNSIRMVTNNFGVENFLPFVVTEYANIDSMIVSDSNPLTDLVTLEVDRATGSMTLVNNSGAAVADVTGVTLVSDTGSVDVAELVDFSGTLGDGESVALDTSGGLWIQSPVEDLRAELAISGGDARTLDVDFVGNGGEKWVVGDLDFDGALDAGDYTVLTANAEGDLSGLTAAEAYQAGDLNGDGFNDVIDFAEFKTAFIDANGAAAFSLLIAGVPEPSSALLAGIGAVVFAARRRRPSAFSTLTTASNPMSPCSNRTAVLLCAAAAALTLAPRSAEAVIFEEFLFDDTAGTPLTETVNNINAGVFWDEDGDTADVATNGLGQLDASLKANTGFGTNYIDVEPGLTTGTIYGIMELTWDFQSPLDTSENEEIRLSFVNSDPRSTEITAEFRITRQDDDQLYIRGQSGGGGGDLQTADTLLNGGSLDQTDKFIAVVAANLDDSTFEVLYSDDNGASFLSAGVADSPAGRIIESVRMTLNNDLSDDNVLIDRLYVTDELPFVVDPDKLTLYVHPISGHAAIVDDTGTPFDIDYYRVQSGDDSLLTDTWKSLEDQGVDAVDGGDDAGETWTEAGGSDEGVLSESFLLSSSTIDPDEAMVLGRVFDLSGDADQLTFEYRDAANGNVFVGDVQLAELMPGDFNLDGRVDAADYAVFRENASGLFSSSDYDDWAGGYGAVFAASSAVSVPEPSAALLVAGIAVGAVGRRE